MYHYVLIGNVYYFGDMVSGISRLVKHGYERSHCDFWVQCDLYGGGSGNEKNKLK